MARNDKGTWKRGDLEIITIVYKGKVVTREELRKIKEEEAKNNDKLRK